MGEVGYDIKSLVAIVFWFKTDQKLNNIHDRDDLRKSVNM